MASNVPISLNLTAELEANDVMVGQIERSQMN